MALEWRWVGGRELFFVTFFFSVECLGVFLVLLWVRRKVCSFECRVWSCFYRLVSLQEVYFLRALIGQLCPAAPGLLGRVGGGVILYLNAFSGLFQ